jgi:hypothetical protein
LRAIQARPPHEQPRGVDRRLHVGEAKAIALVLDDRAAELAALLGVLQRVLVRGPCHADRLRADAGTRALERRHRRLVPAAAALAGPGQALLEPVPAAEQALAGHPAVRQHHLGGVGGADPVLGELLPLPEPGACRAGRRTSRGRAPAAPGRRRR